MLPNRLLDTRPEVFNALRGLLPEAAVAGGSFGHWLPNSATLRPSERQAIFSDAKHLATEQCIADILRQVGFPVVRVGYGLGGERVWPPGFVGSVSHKGVIVIAAGAKSSALSALGIDVERVDRNLNAIKHLVAPEGLSLSVIDEDLSLALTFSAKEAVFKAQYPIHRETLGFSDVALFWTAVEADRWRAVAELAHANMYEVRGQRVGAWVITAAISQAE